MWSRRRLLGAAGLGLAGGLVPWRLAKGGQNGRKFLFLFCQGGWDVTWVFAPMMGNPNVWTDPTAATRSQGSFSWVDGANRPSVSTFFESYASRCCILNGFEVRSVTHERCRRLLFTGTSQSDVDDWPSTIAGLSSGYLFPHMVVSGPAYTSAYTSSVMRVGQSGQLGPLLDGTILETAEPPRRALSASTASRVDELLASRVDDWAAAAAPGRAELFAADLATTREQREMVRSLGALDLGIELNGVMTQVSERVHPALESFRQGYSRCAIAAHLGQFDLGWDSHTGIEMQATHYEVLFGDLTRILQALETTPGTNGQPLSEEVVVVVCSEMNRSPGLNNNGGKDHWTFTSALLIGPGVRGGTVVGGYDDNFMGQAIDPSTGEVREDGTLLSSENFGATLLALAGLDPGEHTPIEACLE